ncbi:hypothetical protein Q764_12470 [Flavobacterium suncheonense GH29-5 = DSM 17707]|uniref:Uncharacterized protein n=1 Tax=Flavobacterium suncheonense GH29-5 = DSM 17707 TaxID=1121899 RepID=A0A0A2MHC7_9FLAO|nr:hypothetical protein Q764_12470 [Flavobacterium suncheonense GH29-5 = DSM 17707]
MFLLLCKRHQFTKSLSGNILFNIHFSLIVFGVLGIAVMSLPKKINPNSAFMKFGFIITKNNESIP